MKTPPQSAPLPDMFPMQSAIRLLPIPMVVPKISWYLMNRGSPSAKCSLFSSLSPIPNQMSSPPVTAELGGFFLLKQEFCSKMAILTPPYAMLCYAMRNPNNASTSLPLIRIFMPHCPTRAVMIDTQTPSSNAGKENGCRGYKAQVQSKMPKLSNKLVSFHVEVLA